MMIGKKKDESSAELFGAPVSAMENFAQKSWIYEEILEFMEKVIEAVLRVVPIGEELTLMEGSDGKDDDKSALRLWDFKPNLCQEVRILIVATILHSFIQIRSTFSQFSLVVGFISYDVGRENTESKRWRAWILFILMSFGIFMNLLLDIYGCKTESLPNAYLQLWL